MPKPTPAQSRRSWLINIALILAVFIGVQWWQARPLVSGPAPALAGTLLDGHHFDLAKDRAGRNGEPTLVYFWATWCPVCRLGQGGIDAIAHDHPVISVAMQSGDADDIQGFMAEQGIAFPVLPDPDGSLASAWGVTGVPASFVIDETGRIRFAGVGHTTEVGLRARLWVASHID
jgi:thiol-disulfide isomerase/thioredoxin